jgi:ubiquinone/menaquinone biosynthesis C-methylase UbiE
MLNRKEALIRKIDEMKEEHLFPLGIASCAERLSPEKPRAHCFHFLEICGGSGKISKALDKRAGLWGQCWTWVHCPSTT